MAPPALPPIYRVKIPCSDEREFRERFAPKYVADGIFVPSVDPKPVGTRLRIKLELRTGVVLVMGDAMVTSRVAPGGSDKPGMTLRITALHPDSLQFELSPAGAPRVSPAPTPRATPPPPPARSPVPPPAAAAAITPPPPSAPRAPAREDLFDFEDEPEPPPIGQQAGAEAPRVARAAEEMPAGPLRAPALFQPPGDEEPPALPPEDRPPEPPPATAPRFRRLALPIAVAAVVVLVAGGGALAVLRKGPSATGAGAARAAEELRLVDLRLREGRLAGPGGESALGHLLAAKRAAPGDPHVAARLALLADTFEQLGDRAIARGNVAEASVHLAAALEADPAREAARRKLAGLGAAKSGGSAPRE